MSLSSENDILEYQSLHSVQLYVILGLEGSLAITRSTVSLTEGETKAPGRKGFSQDPTAIWWHSQTSYFHSFHITPPSKGSAYVVLAVECTLAVILSLLLSAQHLTFRLRNRLAERRNLNINLCGVFTQNKLLQDIRDFFSIIYIFL